MQIQQDNKFFPDDVDGLVDKLIYIKMYFGWAWGWIVFPLAVVNGLTGLLVFLKIFGLWNPVIVGILVFLGFIGIVLFGWLLRVKNIVQRDIDFQTRYNPPIQQLLENTRKDKLDK